MLAEAEAGVEDVGVPFVALGSVTSAPEGSVSVVGGICICRGGVCCCSCALVGDEIELACLPVCLAISRSWAERRPGDPADA